MRFIYSNKWFRNVPGNKNCDNAIFWLGYCVEKQGENPEQAFQYFAGLNREYTSSPWLDDACIHQIGIAEKLIMLGKPIYKDSLAVLLQSSFEEVRRQAALALGKFGDKRALAELNRLPASDEQYQLAASIITWIETRDQVDQPSHFAEFVANKGQADVKPAEPLDAEQTENESSSRLAAESEIQYRAMLRNDDTWSQRELVTFALWHFLPAAEFREYFALSGYDQDEWLRKFWHRKDPTPTTEKNEYEEEINKRIQYARTHYSQLIDFHPTAFQSIQYLCVGKKHAPWDARGELYIKYGAADVDKLYAYQTEQWTYLKYDMDFFVKQYLTNIYGNAIISGPLTQKKNIDLNSYYYTYQEPIYQHDYQAKAIKDIDLKIITQGGGQLIRYDIAADQLTAAKKDNQYIINYRQRIVIFDDDKRRIKTDDQDKILFFNSKKDMKMQKKIGGELKLELAAGKYEIAVSVEDKHSNTIGVWSAEFAVK